MDEPEALVESGYGRRDADSKVRSVMGEAESLSPTPIRSNGIDRIPCAGCDAIPMASHFRSLPPPGVTGTGSVWCDECVMAGKSDLAQVLVDYVKKLHQSP